jgi:hypothetical protein
MASGGITNFPVSGFGSNGVGLVAIYSNPASPEVSIAIMDGRQDNSGDNFLLGLAQPLDKNVDGFSAIMSLGIGHGYQGTGDVHKCGTGQQSNVDINGQRLTSCAGHYDDGRSLITVGGVGDDTNNPPNPNGSGGQDDELYNIAPFLNNGDTVISIDTDNPSNDDIIFLAVIELTARASVGEICGDGIDNDEDGSIDEGCAPSDRDGDGVPDTTDECPDEFAETENGCPLVCEEPEQFSVFYDFNVDEQESNPTIAEIRTSSFQPFTGVEDWSGAGSIQSVQGYTADGFDGTFLRNTAGGNPAAMTTLTLNDLPVHTSIDLEFLLAIIDSWDGSPPGGCCNPDEFNVLVDGVSIFKETFGFNDPSYNPPPNVKISDAPRGFSHWDDEAYNMANDPTFQNIPHTNSTLTIDFFASGAGWQAGNDESWAIENVRVTTNLSTPVCEVPDTDFAEQSVEIGTTNSFSATVYADKKLKIQEFLFGIPNVGEAHRAELGVEVWYDRDGNIDDVKVVQKSDVIDADTVSVSHEKTKCLATDAEPLCDTTTVSMTFLEPLLDKVMAIKAIDYALRDQRTFLNEGFDISGESLNPMLAKMIPSNLRDQGLLKVTQVAKYSPYWQGEDGRMFEMNSFGSFKQINKSFERFQDTGSAFSRLHSEFGGMLAYEQDRATDVFDSSKLISEVPESFAYIFPESGERVTDEMLKQMQLQAEIAQSILDEMDKQDRHY